MTPGLKRGGLALLLSAYLLKLLMETSISLLTHQGRSRVNRWQFTSRCTAVISPHWLPPPRHLAFLGARDTPQMRLRHCPPISILTTPYAFTPWPLPSLRLCSALPACLQHS
ncbi:hypothetical protein O181_095044 [Austropuccinia psidii MF-1]|uniref:Secreted protein n=1 Tax=Austropuccinia psidii MF-1 TaxID=1389203 RepID=A0A9Q3J4B8_9BASI|nr:hypothetical protein [Austropuccinia psidii MF-1]